MIANGDSAKGTSFVMGGCLWFGQWDLFCWWYGFCTKLFICYRNWVEGLMTGGLDGP